MKGRLVGLIVPASVAGVALGATAAAHKGGMISAGVFFWLWPCLVAVLWLVRNNHATAAGVVRSI